MIITSFFLKGGVGKTTIISNLAVHLAKNKKVCIIDLDSQSNIANCFGIFGNSLKTTLIEYLQEPKSNIKDLLIEISPSLSIIPSNSNLIMFDSLKENQKTKLNPLIEELNKSFDYILVDTQPSFNVLSSYFLKLTDISISVFECDTFAFSGLINTIDVLEQCSGLKKAYFITNKFIKNSKNQQETFLRFEKAIKEIKNKKFILLNQKISRSIQSANSIFNERVPLLASRTKSKMKSELEELFKEIKL